MKLYLKFDIVTACKKVLHEQLEKLDLPYSMTGLGELNLNNPSTAKLTKLQQELTNYGIEIVEGQRSILVQKIKDLIQELIYLEEKLPSTKISCYLAEKLNRSYGYISNLFSDFTYSSIEKYIILQRIERAKQLLLTEDMTCSEIGWKLNYSSIAHFSTQFKNVTGLTPTSFQRIIKKRRSIHLD